MSFLGPYTPIIWSCDDELSFRSVEEMKQDVKSDGPVDESDENHESFGAGGGNSSLNSLTKRCVIVSEVGILSTLIHYQPSMMQANLTLTQWLQSLAR